MSEEISEFVKDIAEEIIDAKLSVLDGGVFGLQMICELKNEDINIEIMATSIPMRAIRSFDDYNIRTVWMFKINDGNKDTIKINEQEEKFLADALFDRLTFNADEGWAKRMDKCIADFNTYLKEHSAL